MGGGDFGSRFGLDRDFDFGTSRSASVNAFLGCALCRGKVAVLCDNIEDLQAAAEGVTPVAQAGQVTGKSPCGISAIDGNCRHQEGIDIFKQVIAAGEMHGVELI